MPAKVRHCELHLTGEKDLVLLKSKQKICRCDTRAFLDENEHRRDLVTLQVIVSHLLPACGLTYIISSVLCICFLKRAWQQKEIIREQAAKDLDELENAEKSLKHS